MVVLNLLFCGKGIAKSADESSGAKQEDFRGTDVPQKQKLELQELVLACKLIRIICARKSVAALTHDDPLSGKSQLMMNVQTQLNSSITPEGLVTLVSAEDVEQITDAVKYSMRNFGGKQRKEFEELYEEAKKSTRLDSFTDKLREEKVPDPGDPFAMLPQR